METEYLVTKVSMLLVSKPKAWKYTQIDKDIYSLSYKDLLITNVTGEVNLTYKGRDFNLSLPQKVKLKEAFDISTRENSVSEYVNLLDEIEEILKRK